NGIAFEKAYDEVDSIEYFDEVSGSPKYISSRTSNILNQGTQTTWSLLALKSTGSALTTNPFGNIWLASHGSISVWGLVTAGEDGRTKAVSGAKVTTSDPTLMLVDIQRRSCATTS